MKTAFRIMFVSVLMLSMSAFAAAQENDVRIYRNGDDDGAMDDMDLGAMFAELPGLDLMDGGPLFDMEISVEPGMPMPPGVPPELNLTKEQKDKIKKIRSDAKKAAIPIRSTMELKQIELRELMDSDNPNKDQVAGKIKELEGLKSQLHILRAHAKIDGRSVLTKEQREKLEELRGQHRMMMFNHGEDGPGEGRMMRRFKFKDKD